MNAPATNPTAIRTRFFKLDDGCIRDTGRLFRDEVGALYGLEWTPTLNEGKRVDFDQAKKIASECTLLGGGWQSPQPFELQAIVDYTRFDPAIDTDAFPDTKSGWYWTGTVDASSPSVYAWLVYFGNGSVSLDNQYDGGFIRACRRFSPGQ